MFGSLSAILEAVACFARIHGELVPHLGAGHSTSVNWKGGEKDARSSQIFPDLPSCNFCIHDAHINHIWSSNWSPAWCSRVFKDNLGHMFSSHILISAVAQRLGPHWHFPSLQSLVGWWPVAEPPKIWISFRTCLEAHLPKTTTNFSGSTSIWSIRFYDCICIYIYIHT